ncbi:MAG: thermonuclease family protein [Methylobacter sp.]
MSLTRFKIIPLAFCGLILSYCLSSAEAAEVIEGRVVGVHDGDTVTLLVGGNQQLKVRLAQIDAPESDQAFGQRSKQSLSDMVFNHTIRVLKETVDRYGRTVGTIFVDDLDANKEQIKRGMAWAYRQYLHDRSLLQTEAEARQAKVGLWADPNPTPPWEYRHGGKNKKTNHKTAKTADHTLLKKAVASQPVNSSCGSKRYCKEMASCEEAKFYLTQCGLSRLDKNGDGIPCENLCGHGK